MPTNVRRSTRNSRSRVGYSGVSSKSVKKKVAANQKKTAAKKSEVEENVVVQNVQKEVEKLVDSDEEFTEEEQKSVKKKIVWDNYSKKDLYFKWLKARNDATDLRKEKNDLEEIRKSQAKEIKELIKELKGSQSLYTKNDTLRRKLEDKTAKSQRDEFEKQALIESNEMMVNKLKNKYDALTNKANIETASALGKLELKFEECKLNLDAKEREVKSLTDDNKKLKRKIDKLEVLSFAKSKSDMQVQAMNEKIMIR